MPIHTRLLRAATILALLVWPATVSALPPPAVEGITATLVDGNVRVQWEESDDEEVVRYRIYFSHKSILENGGTYDDFESTPGDAAEFVLTNLPPLEKLYVTVVAVNEAGEESASFGGEAVVELGAPVPASSSASSGETSAAPPAGKLRLLSAEALSQTGVLLTFSLPVTVLPEEAGGAFIVTDASGATVGVRFIAPGDSTVSLATDPLRSSVTYTVRALLVRTADEAAALIAPDAASASFIFAGPSAPAPTFPSAQPLPEPTDVRLELERVAGGGAEVLLTFSVPSADGISSFEVFQSTDGGQTYHPSQELPADARAVRFAGVPPGIFSVIIRSRAADGRVSPGVPASITVARPADRSAPLSDSGAGIAAVLAMTAGAVAGWRRMRK